MEHAVLFLPSNKTCQCEDTASLLSAVQSCGIAVEANCNGNGRCGKCKIRLLEGQVSPVTVKEQEVLSPAELDEGYRLACHTYPLGDVVAQVPDRQKDSTRKKNLNALPHWFTPDVAVSKTYLELKKTTDGADFLTRLRTNLENPALTVAPALLPAVAATMGAKRPKFTATTYKNQLIALENGNTTDQCYGLAVDIGTTTTVAMIWDFHTATMVKVEAMSNPQRIFGADVISRIQATLEDSANIATLQTLIVDGINQMLETMDIPAQSIHQVTIVGNTTMSHLVLGLDPKSLSRVPFAPVFQEGITVTAQSLGLHVSPFTPVTVLPNMAGHVGSDITAVMVCTNIFQLEGTTVAIDIGTNGEILVAKDGEVMACSTAAGPAFEGACIHCGMRAAKGAIEKVVLDQDVTLSVMEGGPAKGLCGTGLIDAVAQLHKAGLLRPDGSLLTQDEAKTQGIPPKLADRLFGSDLTAGFTLAPDVVLLQSDIREVQLAKGAIAGGIETLLTRLGVSTDQVDRVIVAGAFGSYIDRHSAVSIGLLPAVDEEKILAIGNGAGTGASMALLSQAVAVQCEVETKKIQHVELSQDPIFEDFYLEHMNFPESR